MTTQRKGRLGRGSIDKEIRLRFAAHLRRVKEQRDCSIRELAGVIGVSHAYLSVVLRGDSTAGMELLLRCKRTLGISADTWLEEDPEPQYYKPEFGRARRGTT